MQLDLQSVEKVLFSTFAWAFAPKKLENWSSSPQNESELSSRLSRAVSRLSRGPVAGNRRQHFFDPTASNTITTPDRIGKNVISIPWTIAIVFDPVGSKKCWRWFPVTGPLEKREAALGRSWRKLRLILRRGRPIADMFGAKNSCERTEWKVLFRRTANPTA